jgi:ABC-type methionine transport system ATPase subunit
MTEQEALDLHQTKIGMIFQAFYLIPSLPILDNVCLPKTFCGDSMVNRETEGMKLLRRFGIAEQSQKFPPQLSDGQKQRVAIARSLINNPDIILADEPVGNLDSEAAQNVLTILKELNEIDKKTVILVTHNPDHLAYADRVIFMKDGVITHEEVRKEKRPLEIVKVKEEMFTIKEEDIPVEFKMLMQSFKDLTASQTNVLLIPFKAKKLLNHALSELMDEQLAVAESLLNERLFNNITKEELPQRLDTDLDDGGAGWNKTRALSFSERIELILAQSKISQSDETAAPQISQYLNSFFRLNITPKTAPLFQSLVKQRLESQINQLNFKYKLDSPSALGGVGLNKRTAEKVARELEIIMLLKYS